jgi:hypothetical protein
MVSVTWPAVADASLPLSWLHKSRRRTKGAVVFVWPNAAGGARNVVSVGEHFALEVR